MFRNEKLELKVGLFIGAGMFTMFLIVFSISDLYVFKKGYDLYIKFNYVNGVTESAPVRLAGVDVGEVKDITIYYDANAGKTRVKVLAWINGDVHIEEDAVVRINTLGLLGEQYIEIAPGTVKRFLQPGDEIEGKDPVNVGSQIESMSEIAGSISIIAKQLEKGEGTLGKLLTDDSVYKDLKIVLGRLSRGEGTFGRLLAEDTIYKDLEVVFDRLSKGEGTIGKLLAEEKVYNDLGEFVSDVKSNPWKLLRKPARRKTEDK
ncbi:MAG: MlaD family protein [Candidatus Omnitrophota bacterium]